MVTDLDLNLLCQRQRFFEDIDPGCVMTRIKVSDLMPRRPSRTHDYTVEETVEVMAATMKSRIGGGGSRASLP